MAGGRGCRTRLHASPPSHLIVDSPHGVAPMEVVHLVDTHPMAGLLAKPNRHMLARGGQRSKGKFKSKGGEGH
jgi:hypothetical protein